MTDYDSNGWKLLFSKIIEGRNYKYKHEYKHPTTTLIFGPKNFTF